MADKKIIATIIVIPIVIVSVGAWFFQKNSQIDKDILTGAISNSMQEESSHANRASLESKGVLEIDMVQSGFLPEAITIPAGMTVKFINRDSVPRWPASGMHPTHQICRGFDSLGPVQPGQSYSFTFTAVRTCPMHDHLLPSLRGSIVVQ